MPINQIPISKGVFKTQNQRSIRNSEFAENLVNMFIDQAGTNYDRPTLELFATLPSLEIIGMTYFGNLIIAVTFDRKIFSVDTNGVVVNITQVELPGDSRATFSDNGNTLFISGGGTPIKWDGPGNVTLDVGGSPPSVTHLTYLDGFLIGNRRIDSENNKVIQFSEFEAPETWTSANFFSAVSDPDEVQALTVSQRELYVVGEKTTEIWQNVGTSPVPFARAHIWQYGTRAPDSVIQEDNSVFFLDQDKRIIQFSGRSFSRISEGIEEELASYVNVDDCVASSFNYDGSIHIMFNFPSARKCWSVDLRNKQWTEWRGFDNGWARVRINAMTYDKDSSTIYAGDFSTGRIWKFSETLKTDAGGIFKRLRTFCERDLGGSVYKQASLLRINLNRNIASSYIGDEEDTNPTLEIRWKDNDKIWSKWRQIPLGNIGESRYYAEVYRLGIFRSRQYEVQFSDPAQLNIISVESDETVMTS